MSRCRDVLGCATARGGRRRRDAVSRPAETAYHDELGDYFAKNAGSSAYHAHADRPAMLALAGDIAGLKILDVGCGAGPYAAELLVGGAGVAGIDGSATLLRHARLPAITCEVENGTRPGACLGDVGRHG